MDVRIRVATAREHEIVWRETMETVWSDIPETERRHLDRAQLEAHFRPHAKQVLESRENVIFVAEDGTGEVLGYTVVGAATSMLSPVPFGFVFDMWVAPRSRRQGVASRLLDRAADWCRARGCARLKLEVAATNTAGRSLYASNGFREERLFMARDL